MKSKTSPTSPKATNEKEQDKELDKYYQDSLSQIKKPEKRRTPIWFLFLVIIFGFLAGVLGQLVLLSYGSEIPYLDKLDIFSWSREDPFFISLNGDNKTSQIDIEQISENAKNSLVQIYEKKERTDDLSSAYIPGEQLGLAMAITNDGYFLTSQKIINDFSREYVVITETQEIYLVNGILADPSTEFIILQTDVQNMRPPSTVADGELVNNNEVLIVNKEEFGVDPQVELSSITDSHFRVIESTGDYIQSTEFMDDALKIDNTTLPAGSVVYSQTGSALGLTYDVDGHSLIYPFYLISGKINSILENEKIIRPYVGITYVNLQQVTNLPETLTQDRNKGALIYFDEAGDFPGIISNSPAEKAGLQNNDIILMVDNTIVNGSASLSRIIQGYNAGDVITLKILRNSIEQNIKLTLETII